MNRAPRQFGLALLLAVLLSATQAQAHAGLPGAHRAAGPLDLMESGLLWLQDLSGQGELREPADLLRAMQDVMGRQFDLGELALRSGGDYYLGLDILARSHFQNRLRDRLFAELARVFGLFDPVPPRIAPHWPVRLAPDQLLVGVTVSSRYRPPRRIHFHLAYRGTGWRVVDVSSNGELFSSWLRNRR